MSDDYFSDPRANAATLLDGNPPWEHGGFIDRLARLKQAYPDTEVGTTRTAGTSPEPLSLPPSIESPPPIEQKHRAAFSRTLVLAYVVPANAAVGQELAPLGRVAGPQELGFQALSVRVDNPTPYTLFLPDWPAYVPPFVFGYPLYTCQSVDKARVVVAQGSAASGSESIPILLYFTEMPQIIAAPIVGNAPSNSFAAGNNGAALPSTSLQLNEGGIFSWARSVAQGANGTSLDGTLRAMPPGATPIQVASAANAAGVLTIPAVANQLNTLMFVSFAASAVSTVAGNITINFGGVTWTIPQPIGAIGGTTGEAVLILPLPPGGVAATAVNTAIVVTIPALGAGIVGRVNAAYLVG